MYTHTNTHTYIHTHACTHTHHLQGLPSVGQLLPALRPLRDRGPENVKSRSRILSPSSKAQEQDGEGICFLCVCVCVCVCFNLFLILLLFLSVIFSPWLHNYAHRNTHTHTPRAYAAPTHTYTGVSFELHLWAVICNEHAEHRRTHTHIHAPRSPTLLSLLHRLICAPNG